MAPFGGVVLDIGTGDGRFVSALARQHPGRFVIGIDANAKPLEKLSVKATRKPAKGGLPNAMFVQAAVEALPEEFAGTADEIHVNFPWGSLLRGVAAPVPEVLDSLRRVARGGALLEVLVGVDAVRDRAELERLGVRPLTIDGIERDILPRYEAAGFEVTGFGEVPAGEWPRFETSWARRLGGNDDRRVFRLRFRVNG